MKKITLFTALCLLGFNIFAQDTYKLVENKSKNMVTEPYPARLRCIVEKQSVQPY